MRGIFDVLRETQKAVKMREPSLGDTFCGRAQNRVKVLGVSFRILLALS